MPWGPRNSFSSSSLNEDQRRVHRQALAGMLCTPVIAMVVREVIPGIAVFAVVLANRAPLPLAQVGSPFLPRDPVSRVSFNRFCSRTCPIAGSML
jgi:hypothetical protein